MDENQQMNGQFPPRQQRMRPAESLRPRRSGIRVMPIILFVLLVFMTGVAGYEWYSLNKVKKELGVTAQEDVQALVKEVGKLVVLPQGEIPTVATVADPAALKDQQFFAHASKGDKVLIFTQAQKAILYSPSSHKIVEIAPINLNANGSSR
jgi:hypothetical protein